MGLEVDEIALVNPPDFIFFTQLNIIRDIFNNEYENALMPEAIKNTQLLFFQTIGELDTYSQLDCLSGNVELAKDGSTLLDSLDSLTNWAEAGTLADKNQGTFALNTNPTYYVEGTGSIKLDIDAPKQNKVYKLEKTISSEDWSGYAELKLWVDCDYVGGNPPDICVSLNGVASAFLTTFSGAGYYTFDVTGISRSAVTTWGICLQNHDTTAYVAYADHLQGILAVLDYFASGWGESPTITMLNDIAEIYVYEKIADEPVETTITLKISLDSGTTWHTLAGNELRTWVDVSTWVESFTNKLGLRTKIEYTTSAGQKTPKLDDLMIAYKLKV